MWKKRKPAGKATAAQADLLHFQTFSPSMKDTGTRANSRPWIPPRKIESAAPSSDQRPDVTVVRDVADGCDQQPGENGNDEHRHHRQEDDDAGFSLIRLAMSKQRSAGNEAKDEARDAVP